MVHRRQYLLFRIVPLTDRVNIGLRYYYCSLPLRFLLSGHFWPEMGARPKALILDSLEGRRAVISSPGESQFTRSPSLSLSLLIQ